jgi:kynurenine formamidase
MGETFEVGGRRQTVIDLSDCLSNSTSHVEPNRHEIQYLDDEQTAGMSEQLFGIGADYWQDGKLFNVENVTLSTHSGTHVDAPLHYGPPASGDRGRSIDEVPLRWCMGDGVLLDFTGKQAGEGITRPEVEAELDRIGYALKPFDIVLVMTGASRLYGQKGYENASPGLRRDATEYMVDRGVRLIGIDAWGIDRPFDVMVPEAKAGDREQLWESHILGRTKEYCQIERLANLEEIPRPHGFVVSALPIKLERAGAGWARVVAIFDEPA